MILLALLLGLASATLALAIRRAETAMPDPGDIEIRTGLMHMLTGLIAWAAYLSLFVVAVFVSGLILPALAAAALAAALLFNWGSRLIPLYRLQIPLAATALLIAIAAWLALITLFVSEPFTLR